MKRISTECDIHEGAHPAKERSLVLDGRPLVIDACDDFVTQLEGFHRNNLAVAAADIAGLAPQQVHSPNGKVSAKAAVAPAKKAPAKKAVSTKKATVPAAFTEAAAEVVDANGLRAGDSDFPCFCCPQVLQQSAWQGHAKTHGFATARDMTGDQCPLCNDKHGRLTNHAKEKHGIANAALLFQTAIRDGDQYGIVAKRIKAAKNTKLM